MPSDSEISTDLRAPRAQAGPGETQSHRRGFLSQPHSSRSSSSSSSSSCVPIDDSLSTGEHLRVCVCACGIFLLAFSEVAKDPNSRTSNYPLVRCSMFESTKIT
ncbi:unnamed protein product [Pylaiella littoralis]